jgi:hypothetical protein
MSTGDAIRCIGDNKVTGVELFVGEIAGSGTLEVEVAGGVDIWDRGQSSLTMTGTSVDVDPK